SSEFHREICNLIKEFNVRNLSLEFKNKTLEKEVMVESFVLDLARTFRQLWINSNNVTPDIIHEFYKIMLDGSTKLRYFYTAIKQKKMNGLLALIGITYIHGIVFSNRDIEVYKEENEWRIWYVFDRQVEMRDSTILFHSILFGMRRESPSRKRRMTREWRESRLFLSRSRD
ncbi:hypothetical protein PENTCL1PPCAC_442, partial [Pristionchus entomophagus]